MNKGKILNAIAQNNSLSETDTVILNYGIKRIVATLLDVIFTFIIGSLLGIVVESMVFQFSFILLRTYGGGYHSKTKFRCEISSAIITIASLTGIRRFENIIFDYTWIMVLFAIAIGIMAPVEAKNKPLSLDEKRDYHNKVIRILITLCFFAIFSSIWTKKILVPIAVAIYDTGFLVVLGKIKILEDRKKM